MQVNRWQFGLPWRCSGVRLGANRLMDHIQGFARSHWMPPSVDCLRHIAPVAVMFDKFE
jgi:hypothetical protein